MTSLMSYNDLLELEGFLEEQEPLYGVNDPVTMNGWLKSCGIKPLK